MFGEGVQPALIERREVRLEGEKENNDKEEEKHDATEEGDVLRGECGGVEGKEEEEGKEGKN